MLAYHRAEKRELVPTVDSQLIESLCALVISLLQDAKLDLADANQKPNEKGQYLALCSKL